MKLRVLIAFVLNMGPGICLAETAAWRSYVIPSTGAKVDIPVSIFTEDAGSPEGGTGRRSLQKTTGQISPSSQFQTMAMPRLLNFCRRGDRPPAFNTSG